MINKMLNVIHTVTQLQAIMLINNNTCYIMFSQIISEKCKLNKNVNTI
jgi:hypothetical protein